MQKEIMNNMIKPNELRLRSLIMYQGKIREVGAIKENSTYSLIVDKTKRVVSNWQIAPFDELEGIPLTEEILLKCGFEKRQPDEDYNYFGIGNFTLAYGRVTDNTFAYFLNGYHNDVHIKYLHQLQMIYFSLTGKELEVKQLTPGNNSRG